MSSTFSDNLRSMTGATLYSVNRRNDSWRYASVRLFAGVVEVTAPGYMNWTPLAEVEASPLNAHQRFVVKLAHHALAHDMGAPLAEGINVAYPTTCGDGCGRVLTHPRSIEAGMGPQCRGLYDKQRERAAARRAAAASFSTRMAQHKGLPAPQALAVAIRPRCPGTCSTDQHCPDCD